jgi:hypothetical protein
MPLVSCSGLLGSIRPPRAQDGQRWIAKRGRTLCSRRHFVRDSVYAENAFADLLRPNEFDDYVAVVVFR